MPNRLLKVAFFFCGSFGASTFIRSTFGWTTGWTIGCTAWFGYVGFPMFIIGFFTCGCCAGNTFGCTGFVYSAFHAPSKSKFIYLRVAGDLAIVGSIFWAGPDTNRVFMFDYLLAGGGGGICCFTGSGSFLPALSPNMLNIAAFFFGSTGASTFLIPLLKSGF